MDSGVRLLAHTPPKALCSTVDATQDRREFKFLLPADIGDSFRSFVASHIPVDRGAESGYPVLSEYFDTDDRHSYWQKIWGAGNRRRVRARVYGHANGLIPPSGFIEIKHKSGSIGVKRRAALPIHELPFLSRGEIPPDLLRANRSRADKHVVEELKDLVVRDGARPVVQVRYDRMAYDSGKDGTIRVTFDSGLRCRFDLKPLQPDDQDFPLPVVDGNRSVVEIKTIGPVPNWLRRGAAEFRLSTFSMSKYCNSLERFDPAVTASPLEIPPIAWIA